MTIRNAIILCETDNNCAGFTYKGAIWDLDEIYDVYFFTWVHILFLFFTFNSFWGKTWVFYPKIWTNFIQLKPNEFQNNREILARKQCQIKWNKKGLQKINSIVRDREK